MTVVAVALAGGMRAGLRCILGDLLGGVVIVGAAYAGLGAVLGALALAFGALKWGGVVYLGWLGVRQVRAARHVPEAPPLQQERGGLLTGFLTGALNPKAIVFYMAFLAQFLDQSAPLGPQMLVVLATSSVIVATVLTTYAALALRMARVWQDDRARRRMACASGSALIGASLWMATTR